MIRSEVLLEHLSVNTDVHTLCKVSRMYAENLRVVFSLVWQIMGRQLFNPTVRTNREYRVLFSMRNNHNNQPSREELGQILNLRKIVQRGCQLLG